MDKFLHQQFRLVGRIKIPCVEMPDSRIELSSAQRSVSSLESQLEYIQDTKNAMELTISSMSDEIYSLSAQVNQLQLERDVLLNDMLELGSMLERASEMQSWTPEQWGVYQRGYEYGTSIGESIADLILRWLGISQNQSQSPYISDNWDITQDAAAQAGKDIANQLNLWIDSWLDELEN